MGRIVQIALAACLFAGLAVPCVMFYKQLAAKTLGKKVVIFLIVEVLLLAAVAGVLWWRWRPDDKLLAFVAVSVVLTMLANIPAAFVAKLVCRKPEPTSTPEEPSEE